MLLLWFSLLVEWQQHFGSRFLRINFFSFSVIILHFFAFLFQTDTVKFFSLASFYLYTQMLWALLHFSNGSLFELLLFFYFSKQIWKFKHQINYILIILCQKKPSVVINSFGCAYFFLEICLRSKYSTHLLVAV